MVSYFELHLTNLQIKYQIAIIQHSLETLAIIVWSNNSMTVNVSKEFSSGVDQRKRCKLMHFNHPSFTAKSLAKGVHSDDLYGKMCCKFHFQKTWIFYHGMIRVLGPRITLTGQITKSLSTCSDFSTMVKWRVQPFRSFPMGFSTDSCTRDIP